MSEMRQRPRISVVLNTFNAERYLDRVLQALVGFDEIVVVDMFSTDKTREIAEKYGAKIVDFERCGICEPARNAAIQSAGGEWVLIVDADEIVTPQLRDYLYNVIVGEDAPAALRIPRINRFMGRRMKSLYPDYVTRFARRDSIQWPATIHSQPIVEGEIESIPQSRRELALIHLEENSISSRLEKTQRYAENEVKRRGNRRYPCVMYFAKPMWRFFHSYIVKGGWRDGRAGFMWALLELYYKLTTMLRQSGE